MTVYDQGFMQDINGNLMKWHERLITGCVVVWTVAAAIGLVVVLPVVVAAGCGRVAP